MENNEVIQSINENIEIVARTFKPLGLKVTKCNVISIADSGEVELGIEVEGLSEKGSIPQDVTIKVVAYDDKGNILGVENAYLYEERFSGFDVLWVYLNQDQIGFRTRSLKVFAQAG